ncbi:hypothetical protein I8752_31205 [Nostocaceae cyanobacterium CENA369]|uniref:Uncharacterized protein n=1 Tax=Dendronalium phyllosphericum CENA369 TaxID=1725256 RepID=A0A8J7ID77_9NOST|nr:hypothetical protein [Dendronalium phyllosphericum]MBH8577358.1 hypothetical protein [Dendronalium phyllosphericum CENA369]
MIVESQLAKAGKPSKGTLEGFPQERFLLARDWLLLIANSLTGSSVTSIYLRKASASMSAVLPVPAIAT